MSELLKIVYLTCEQANRSNQRNVKYRKDK